jgi:hypothetical protein
MAVGEDDRVDLVKPLPDPAEVGQDHVHARLVLLREQHPAVHYQESAAVLEHSHVAADLAEAAESDYAQGAVSESGRWAEVGMGVAHSVTVSETGG